MASSQQHLPSYIVLILKKILHSSITIQLRTSLYYNPLGRLNLMIPTFSFEPKHENNITKKKKKNHDRISAILHFLSCSKALTAISLAWTKKAQNFLSFSVAFAALSCAVSVILVASVVVWVTALFLSCASCSLLCSKSSFCCTKWAASFSRIQMGLSSHLKKGHFGPTCS